MTQKQFALPRLHPCQVPTRILAPSDLQLPFNPPSHLECSASSSISPIISTWPNDPSPARPRSNFASSVKLSLCPAGVSLSYSTLPCTAPMAQVTQCLITCVHVLRTDMSSTMQKHGLQRQTDLGTNPSSATYPFCDLGQVI